MGQGMAWYGFGGFLIGMILGGLLNGYLLRHRPREEWRTNRSLRLKYGALNWLIALAGLVVGLYINRMV